MKKETKKEVKKESKKEVEKEKISIKRILITTLSILILIISLIFIYARYVGTEGLKVREYNIKNSSIPSSFDGFSIVHFSDLKLGSTMDTEKFKKVVDKINELEPDIVVFTGDLVSFTHKVSSKEEKNLIKELKRIDPLIGKYSVRGDGDTVNDLYDRVMKESEFHDLTNSYDLIYYKGLTPIVMYGLDSLLEGHQNAETTFAYPSSEEDTTYMATYRILLAHEPDTAKKISEYNISLMLSGHSKNSEINIPYLRDLYNIKGAETYYNEEYNIGKTKLYISSGLGTSKFKMRLFSKPSISIYRLYTD